MPGSDCVEIPGTDRRTSVAVIGAGISGLTCSRALADHGYRVVVFEKSRGVGGRMATRRAMNGACTFDHGAQYFTSRDGRFKNYLEAWCAEGIAAPWRGEIVAWDRGIVEGKVGTERFIAVPGMNSIAKSFAQGLDINLKCLIAPPRRSAEQWELSSVEGQPLGLFDVVVISAPAGQAAQLLRDASSLSQRASEVAMSGCWTLMLALEKRLELEFDAAFIHHSPLSWISRDSSKFGRKSEYETWVLHASPEWTEQNLEASAVEVESKLLPEFSRIVETSTLAIVHQASHLWRFALPEEPLSESCLFDDELQIGACGDWCGGPRVEGAFLSGLSLAENIIQCCPSSLIERR